VLIMGGCAQTPHIYTMQVSVLKNTQFDPGNGLDNIGWDGRYGIFGVWDWNDKVVARIGYRHLSAHLGDEYIEATGRRRINYTRDDLALGLGFFFSEHILIYVEPSWAWSMGNQDRQKRWAAEGGVQSTRVPATCGTTVRLFTLRHMCVRLTRPAGIPG